MSVIKVNKIESTGTTAGGVEVDSSGHVQVDGVQMPTAGALSNRNLIINGAMNVAQRGTSATTNGYGTVDRFKPGFTGGAQTQTQETLTSGSPYNEGFRKFLRLTNTTASTGTSDLRRITYLMEGQDIAGSGWNYTSSSSYITLSFWARASVSQTYYVEVISNDGTTQNYTFAVSLTANTWTKIEKTIPGNSSITFDNDTGAALQIDFLPFFGTDYTDSGFTTDAWAAFSGSSRAPDFTNTWANTTNATFDLTGVQLEVGEKATPFEHRSYGDELARCERYFEVIRTHGEGFTGYSFHQTAGTCPIRFRTKKRATPGTITLGTAGTAAGNIAMLTSGGNYPSTVGSHQVNAKNSEGFRLYASGYAGLDNDTVSLLYGNGDSLVAKVDAEL